MSDPMLVQPKNTLPKIETVYAFVSVDPLDGNEGVCAAPMGGLGLVPLIAFDAARLESIRPIAADIAKMSGMKIKLVKFTQREEVEEI